MNVQPSIELFECMEYVHMTDLIMTFPLVFSDGFMECADRYEYCGNNLKNFSKRKVFSLKFVIAVKLCSLLST